MRGRPSILNRFAFWRARMSARDIRVALDAVLDEQDRIEARTYDSKVGRAAVFASRKACEALPLASAAPEFLQAAFETLETVEARQRRNRGEHSSGASTVRAIANELRRRTGGKRL